MKICGAELWFPAAKRAHVQVAPCRSCGSSESLWSVRLGHVCSYCRTPVMAGKHPVGVDDEAKHRIKEYWDAAYVGDNSMRIDVTNYDSSVAEYIDGLAVGTVVKTARPLEGGDAVARNPRQPYIASGIR